ncbi:right-handed parallel beta-helix repeat-containing protein [Halorubrum sp. 2020YC2]|uniref:right-handed parallel beta-helix repeat-containing protein n=1 Tax=Halorubrum sp. 2020YC2 TaxID=2836432 RepID=UPI001BE73615|nr:right-handed parallel beta-helix repeat-containing protein [Halorubrum sp. 2020YC2]QWC20205.1 hypothetical protein KI388_04440 [Halorubrum sp. 2020YC2]
MSKERAPDDSTVGEDYRREAGVGSDYEDGEAEEADENDAAVRDDGDDAARPADARDGRLLDRRGYLKMAGVAAAAVAAGSTGAAGAEGTTRHGIEFDRVLDAVDDLGMDPSGNSAVNARLEHALTEGTLVRFPEGEYLFDGEFEIDADRVGVLGEGDVRFVPRTGHTGFLFNYDPVPDDVLIEGVDVDMRADDTTTGIRLRCRNRFHIEDVEFLGRGLIDNSGQVSAFLLGITSEDGRGVLRDAVAKKGSRVDGYARGNGRIGVWVGWSNKGTVRIEGCDFREFGNNGTYSSRTPGQVEIVDCYFLNNNAANVRIGGEGSYIENCTVEIDFEKYTGPELGDISTGFGMRGVQIEQGVQLEGAESIPAGAVVRDCELVGKNAPNGIAMLNLSPQGRSLTVENTRVRVDIDRMWAVRRGRPGTISWREWQQTAPKPHWIRMENVSVTGSASGREAIKLVEADDSVVRNCCIHQPGSNRDGVKFEDASGGVVEDSTIDVTGKEITLENSTATSSSITREGSCPFPDPEPASTDGSDETDDADPTRPDGSQELVIDGGHTADRISYTFAVDGSVAPGPRANASDTIDGTTVSGHVEGGVDSFWVSGEFTDFEVDGDAEVRLAGEAVDPADLVVSETDDGTDDGGSTDETELVIDGGHTADRISYAFAVDGSVAPGDRANPDDTIDGTTVTGQVEGGIDSFLVTGEFTDFEVDGDAEIRLAGEAVDPADLVVSETGDGTDDGSSTESETLVIDGSGTYDRVSYAFEVDGSVAPGDRANPGDTIDGTTVTGHVEGGIDSFEVAGEFTAFDIDADVPVRLGGETVDPDDLVVTTRTVAVDGSHTSERLAYTFGTDGTVAPAGDVTDDAIDGSTAAGSVAGGVDAYEVTGAFTNFQVDGDLAVRVDGEPVEPEALGTEHELPHELVVVGDGAEASYLVETTGSVAKRDGGWGAEESDAAADGVASGTVADDRDTFGFSGDVTRLRLDGDASLSFRR